MRRALLVSCAACGRIGFGALAAHDGGGDGDAAAAVCDWSRGPTFSPILAHPELDSTQYEADPFLTPGDPLTMHLSSFRSGLAKIYVTHRAVVGGTFDTPVELGAINDANGDEDSLYLFPTGDHGWFSWIINPLATTPTADIYEVITQAGALVIGRRVSEIDDAFVGDHYNPWPSPDNLELTFATGPTPNYHIYFASRSDVSQPWGNFVELADSAAVSQPASGATLTANRLVIVWSQGPHGNSQLYYATRASANDAFGPATQLPFSTTQFDDNTPQIRDDGCELFYAHALANSDWDIASVDVMP